jgi:hypothetical protein
MSQEIARTERERLEQRQADEVVFREAWLNWRQGRSREEAEAKAAWLLENGAPVCGAVAQRELERESAAGGGRREKPRRRRGRSPSFRRSRGSGRGRPPFDTDPGRGAARRGLKSPAQNFLPLESF